ncbi:MAG TPA: RIO1 family regulatory kinase/ATPase, partial [Myxococcaceae bacterium]|nr:RIO1 family regulatory kinase/ATPase [Myxococcaceae bacterium]
MTHPLDPLVADGVIDSVLSRLKSGKEADIYLVQHAGEIVAAKVYKERHVRSFKNNAAYKEGRAVRNSRTQRAMDKGSRFGRAAEEDAWKTKEADALQILFTAGVRVPKPHLFYEGVLLMEVVVDTEGHPAPRLLDATIPRERAAEWYADLRRQVVTMLTRDIIHGDLSPYNVLLAWNGPTVIDFPQVVGAAHNNQAESFFRRDLETIHRFFASIDPALQLHAQDAQEIWRAYVKRELNTDFVPPARSEPMARPSRLP